MTNATVATVEKGRTEKAVTIINCPNDQCESYVTALAMAAAGETPVSLFGTHVRFFNLGEDGITAVVRLYTD